MKYRVVYQTMVSDETHQKWVASLDYEIIAENLLRDIEVDPTRLDMLVVPYILTLCAWLEASINDWLIIDTFRKHGIENYQDLAEGYTFVSFAKKLRLVVAVMTDNTFQLRNESRVVQTLDNLIRLRNRLTHPTAYFFQENSRKDAKQSTPDLSIEECRQYFDAVDEFGEKFFKQYDEGYVEENELIKEIEPIGSRIVIEAYQQDE